MILFRVFTKYRDEIIKEMLKEETIKEISEMLTEYNKENQGAVVGQGKYADLKYRGPGHILGLEELPEVILMVKVHFSKNPRLIAAATAGKIVWPGRRKAYHKRHFINAIFYTLPEYSQILQIPQVTGYHRYKKFMTKLIEVEFKSFCGPLCAKL
jgi:hypothetical protein